MTPVPARSSFGHDEPWLRPPDELTAAWPRIVAAMDALIAPVPADTPFERLSARQRHLLGVHAAAAWVLGATDRAPMTSAVRPVLFPDLAQEQALAVRASRGEHAAWQDYARGVLHWLWYLTGVVDVLLPDG